MSPAADEIARIEHELDILRSRYAIFERWAKIMKWFSISLAVVVTAAIVGYGIVRDPLVAAVMALVVVVIGGAIYLIRDSSAYRWIYLTRASSADRWIDSVSPSPGWRCGGPKSEAAAIETMIAEREARLADIRKQHA
jgi:hypothetical protein